jgi:hypothetical protein
VVAAALSQAIEPQGEGSARAGRAAPQARTGRLPPGSG